VKSQILGHRLKQEMAKLRQAINAKSQHILALQKELTNAPSLPSTLPEKNDSL
jgi:hypothetical protein